MNQFRVADRARADLDDIWIYIAQDNPEAADKYLRTIVSRFPTLAAMPLIGRERHELSPGLRSFVVGHHVIFYRLSGNDVEIIRVLDGARDLPPLFD